MTDTPPPGSARGRWLVLAAALLGWMFDGLEMGLFPLVATDALNDLLAEPTPESRARWFAIITAGFLIGAATGGVVFGWLGDRIGRVRAMMLSVLTYALFSGVCGLAAEAWQVALFRCVAALGMGGEWSLGVALVMEVWPDRSRGWLAGVIGAAANLGYCLIAVLGLSLNLLMQETRGLLEGSGLSPAAVDWLTRHHGWRLLMLLGATPALLTILIRLLVPESHRWQAERDSGATRHWNALDLLAVVGGAVAAGGIVVLTLLPDLATPLRLAGSLGLFALCLAGYLYPVVRYTQRGSAGNPRTRFWLGRLLLAAALSGVVLLGTWGTTQNLPTLATGLKCRPEQVPQIKPAVQIATSLGATAGCVLAALLGARYGRRRSYSVLCVLSMLAVWNVTLRYDAFGTPFLLACFATGLTTGAFYGWLPLYLPELFTTRLRATGQGFGYNFGRILAAVGVLQLPAIMRDLQVGWGPASAWLALVYAAGLAVIRLAPETRGKPLPD